ncbi:MAG: hypothetical protein V4641_30370 [Pseudomonadota bacterium]
MAKITTVGCKLPHGIVLEHPADPKNTVTLRGLNRISIIGADYATTEVDGDLMDAWLAANKGFPALENGAIFIAKSASDAVAIAAEFKGVETGLEPMRTDGKDKRARGVKTADGNAE